jgi:hypothetical protein
MRGLERNMFRSGNLRTDTPADNISNPIINRRTTNASVSVSFEDEPTEIPTQ